MNSFLLQVADLVFPALGISERVYRVLVIVSLAGAPVALLLSWLFDVTPEGIRLATSSGEAGRVVAGFRPLFVYGRSSRSGRGLEPLRPKSRPVRM